MTHDMTVTFNMLLLWMFLCNFIDMFFSGYSRCTASKQSPVVCLKYMVRVVYGHTVISLCGGLFTPLAYMLSSTGASCRLGLS